MSAPQIPNLNTLRRGGPRLRGRGRGDGSDTPSRSAANKDETIQRTDFDAASSRVSAVEAGYLVDPFATRLTSGETVTRRLPLMNRGTYCRTIAIDKIVSAFHSSPPHGRKQIISLGAGSDTRFFRLRQQNPSLDLIYHELDFPTNTRAKIQRLREPSFAAFIKQSCHFDLSAATTDISADGTSLSSETYNIHPIDLRSLTQLDSPHSTFRTIQPDLPTLLISECCLCYLPPALADGVLDFFTQTLFPPDAPVGVTPLAVVIYEPIRPHDAFGRTMTRNLADRGIELGTVEKYGELSEQEARLRRARFGSGSDPSSDHGKRSDQRDQGERIGQADVGGAQAWDIDTIWRKWVGKQEKERVEGLEWMDEVEEFVLLAKHYCVSCGWRGFENDEAWRALCDGM